MHGHHRVLETVVGREGEAASWQDRRPVEMEVHELLAGEWPEAEPAQPAELALEHGRVDVQTLLPRYALSREPVVGEHDV